MGKIIKITSLCDIRDDFFKGTLKNESLELDNLYKLIGCDIIQIIPLIPRSALLVWVDDDLVEALKNVVLILDEEGKIKNKSVALPYYEDCICGTVILASQDEGGNLVPLNDEEYENIKAGIDYLVRTSYYLNLDRMLFY